MLSITTLLRSVPGLALAGLLLGSSLPSAVAAAPLPADLAVDILPPAPLSAAGTSSTSSVSRTSAASMPTT